MTKIKLLILDTLTTISKPNIWIFFVISSLFFYSAGVIVGIKTTDVMVADGENMTNSPITELDLAFPIGKLSPEVAKEYLDAKKR